jgi:hypothetical protein
MLCPRVQAAWPDCAMHGKGRVVRFVPEDNRQDRMIGATTRGEPNDPTWREWPASLPAIAQGLYYVITGVWPLLSMRSFEAVTGPKVDTWLVKTVGLLLTVIGLVEASAGVRRTLAPEVSLLGVGSAAALATVDIVYVRIGRISKVFLLDALAELLLIAAWTRAVPFTR